MSLPELQKEKPIDAAAHRGTKLRLVEPPEPPTTEGLISSLRARHREDGRILTFGLLLAILLHVLLALAPLPEFKRALKPKTPTKVVYVRKYLPPPPPVERRSVAKTKHARKIPVPDPTPDEPEPIREPELEVYPDYYPSDAEILIGTPEAPPAVAAAPAPKLPGVGGVTNPERIPESYVKPAYPELARKARLEARLILQAVITRDGTVTEIEVLKCNHPVVGFEEAAIEAVEQWRYNPALQNGTPVDVYFTIVVTFTLE